MESLSEDMMVEINGIGVAPGIAIGQVLVVRESEAHVGREKGDVHAAHDAASEKKRLAEAVRDVDLALEALIRQEGQLHEIVEIMQAHQMMIADPELVASAEAMIDSGKSAYDAYADSAAFFCEMLAQVDDPYLRQRVQDIKDSTGRVLDVLSGREVFDPALIKSPVILVANDIPPSMAARFTAGMVLGIVTEIGGETSHTAILANALGIPAVLGVADAVSLLDEKSVILDGQAGRVIISPDAMTYAAYASKADKLALEQEELRRLVDVKTMTVDGIEIELYGNIGSPEEARLVAENGGEGVGLFRTEFLFMDATEAPSEDAQFNAYKAAVMHLSGRPVIIRTLDVGGDKHIPYLDIPKEDNPFLGYRAIRYCLDHEPLFKTQIKAILRAAVYGSPKIMLPMISKLDEILRAKALIKTCEAELDAAGVPFSSVPVGIMVETPAAAIMADVFAKHVDFFSIGTNDLTQYTLAADRMNPMVKDIYSYFDPSVLRLVAGVIKAANEAGIHVGMCGEAAGNEQLIPVLLSMGLREFSVSPGKLLKVKEIMLKTMIPDKMVLF